MPMNTVHISSLNSDNKSMHSLEKFLGNVIRHFKNKGYNFNHIAEIKINS